MFIEVKMNPQKSKSFAKIKEEEMAAQGIL